MLSKGSENREPDEHRIMAITTADRASLVAQTVKHLPAMQETWVRSLGQEDILEKGMATLQYSCLENPMDREVHGITNGRTRLSN